MTSKVVIVFVLSFISFVGIPIALIFVCDSSIGVVIARNPSPIGDVFDDLCWWDLNYLGVLSGLAFHIIQIF